VWIGGFGGDGREVVEVVGFGVAWEGAWNLRWRGGGGCRTMRNEEGGLWVWWLCRWSLVLDLMASGVIDLQ